VTAPAPIDLAWAEVVAVACAAAAIFLVWLIVAECRRRMRGGGRW
jgi:hypothetical protein